MIFQGLQLFVSVILISINIQFGFALGTQRIRLRNSYIHFRNAKSDLRCSVQPEIEQDNAEKKQALELLDCLTSPTNTEDPQYDVEKDIRRDNMLLSNDYHDLKLELKERGLRTGGDKLEMITRLLLHIIDPKLDYNKLTGHEPNLKYVESSDIGENKVTMFPVDQRQPSPTIDDIDLDADDIQITKGVDIFASPSKSTKSRVIMDGLTRREIDYSVQLVTRLKQSKNSNTKSKKGRPSKQQDEFSSMKAYVVAGRDVLKTWQKTASVIIFCPDESGWRSKTNRVIADELAFSNQAIVVVPDIYPHSLSSENVIINNNNNNSKNGNDELSHEERVILDHILSTIHYCRLEYKPRSICIAGVGVGATWAARASCDMWDIASLALQQIKKNDDDDGGGDDDVRSKHIKNKKIDENTDRVVFFNETVRDAEASSTPKPKVHLGHATKVFINKPKQNLIREGIELIDKNQQQLQQQDEQQINDENDDSILDNAQDSTAEIEIEGIQFDETNTSIVNMEDNNNENDITDEYDLSKIDTTGMVDSIMKKIMRDTNDNNHDNNHDLNSNISNITRIPIISMSEKQAKRKMTESERKEKEAYFRVQQSELDQLAFENSIKSAQQRFLLNLAHATLSVTDLVYMAPRALLCLNPVLSAEGLKRLGTSLRLPVAIMCGGSDKDSADSMALHHLLSQRKQQIEDFCIRRYESASPKFMIAPLDTTDTKSRQDALSIGGMWLDSYSRDPMGDTTRGSGRTKYDDTEGYFIVTRAHLARLGEYSSAVADYLHDDPELSLDYTQQEEEAREKINKKPADVSAKIEEMLNQQQAQISTEDPKDSILQ